MDKYKDSQTGNILLLLIWGMFFAGMAGMILKQAQKSLIPFIAVAGMGGLMTVLQYQVQRRKLTGDRYIVPLLFFLNSIGLLMIYRLRPDLFWLQFQWLVVGCAIFVIVVHFMKSLEEMAQYKYLIGIIGVGMLVVTLIFGVEIGGHKDWLVLGPIRFQPTELVKLCLIFFLAGYFDNHMEMLIWKNHRWGVWTVPPMRIIAPVLSIWGLTMLMVVFQRDLGSALLYFSVTVGMLYLASGRVSYVVLGMGLFFCGAALCYQFYTHVQTRVDIWWNPWIDPSGRGYQILQSLFAFGTGGLWGQGLSNGHPELIPEVHTDFILAAIGEELGFLGVMAVLLVYILLVYRCFHAAFLQKNRFLQLIAGGISLYFGLQVFLISSGVVKFFPLTGITLPFISYGGSSMSVSWFTFAVVFLLSEVRYLNEIQA